MAQWIEHRPANQSHWFDSQSAHTCVVGQIPSRGHMRGNHTLIFLSLSSSLPLSLKINK